MKKQNSKEDICYSLANREWFEASCALTPIPHAICTLSLDFTRGHKLFFYLLRFCTQGLWFKPTKNRIMQEETDFISFLHSWDASQMVLTVKNPPANAGDATDVGLILGLRRLPWSRKWQLTSVFLLEKSHGQRGLVGCSPSVRKESDGT